MSLQGRPQAGQVLLQFRSIPGRDVARVFDHAFPNRKREVETREPRVPLLKTLHDAQRMNVVVEIVSERSHLMVQLLFPRVSEGRVPDVMRQRQRFREVLVETHRRGERACNLGDFHRVRQAIAEVVGESGAEDLRFIFQPPKSPRMDDAVAVALKVVPVRMRLLGIAPADVGSDGHPDARQTHFLTGISANREIATRLAAPLWVRSGSRSFRASSGLVFMIRRARVMVA